MPSAQHPAIGFQAVILCGPGTSLYPFTQDEDLPKALLPVANKPMLHYPLEWCEKAGFDSILVLTLTEHLNPIQSFLRSHRTHKTAIHVQVEAASSLNDNLGTADVLRVAHGKGWINSDFAVIPCDIVTNLDGAKLAEMWMVTQASFDSDLGRRARKHKSAMDAEDGRRGGLAVWYQTMGEGAIKGQETDFVAAAPLTRPSTIGNEFPDGDVGVLLTTAPTLALKGLNQLPVRHGMMKRHPDVKLYTTFRDAGIYFFPYWVLKFIEKNPKLNSVREDVLPWIAKSRWQNTRLAKKLGLEQILNGEPGANTETESFEDAQQAYDVGSMSTARTRRPEDARETFKREDVPPIVAYLPTEQSLFVRRVDTVHLYLFTSLHLAKSDPTLPATQVKIDPTAHIGEKAIVTQMDCLIAEKVSIGERCVIKKSVLGTGVSIGRGARIMGCVLMDGASVAENAKLEGCTIGRKANIGAKVNLKDCEVADGYMVEDGVDAKGERFVSFTGLDADSDDYESEAVEGADEDYDSEADEDFEPGSSGDTGSTTDSEDSESITAVVSGDEEVKAGTAL